MRPHYLSARQPLPLIHASINSFLTLGKKETRLNQVEAHFCLCFHQPLHNLKKIPVTEEKKDILPQKVAEGFCYVS